jgi:hypothetical protein
LPAAGVRAGTGEHATVIIANLLLARSATLEHGTPRPPWVSAGVVALVWALTRSSDAG